MVGWDGFYDFDIFSYILCLNCWVWFEIGMELFLSFYRNTVARAQQVEVAVGAYGKWLGFCFLMKPQMTILVVAEAETVAQPESDLSMENGLFLDCR